MRTEREMYLTRLQTAQGPRWALDGHSLPQGLDLSCLLALPNDNMVGLLEALPAGAPAEGHLLPPIDSMQEVWASGVTYQRSRDARQVESKAADVYERVYNAERPELFFKAIGWRVVGHRLPVRTRRDGRWNVPEPEMVLVVNSCGEMVGFCVGNDMSSRDIEGENPLYLPQAKIYNGSCALGPGICLIEPGELTDLPVHIEILRANTLCFEGETRTSRMARPLTELAAYLFRELDWPNGVFLMTGTGIVPPDTFTLAPGDVVRISVGSLRLENEVS
jgi:2-dehydro-3-deoxy-D-arabinonate dehydratase